MIVLNFEILLLVQTLHTVHTHIIRKVSLELRADRNYAIVITLLASVLICHSIGSLVAFSILIIDYSPNAMRTLFRCRLTDQDETKDCYQVVADAVEVQVP